MLAITATQQVPGQPGLHEILSQTDFETVPKTLEPQQPTSPREWPPISPLPTPPCRVPSG